MNSTFASIFVIADNQEAAQSELGTGFFTTPLSETGQAPATHYWSTGYFLDSELDTVVNDSTWLLRVKFGDAQAALNSMKLLPVCETTDTEDNSSIQSLRSTACLE